MNSKAVEVFIAYSHRDRDLLEELEVHLSLLRRQGRISNWSDREITPGAEWVGEINTRINTAQIVLLLITPRFLASDYSYDVELEKAIARHEAGEAIVVPIILKPCDWKSTPFSQLQVLPKDGKPITTWDDQDEAFVNVAKGIRRIVDSLKTTPTQREVTNLKRVLILAANPKDATPSRLDAEVREIDEGLKRSRSRERFVIAQRWAVRPRDIRRAILDVEPSFVHFANHGVESHLSFEDSTGQSKTVSPDALADLFHLFSNQVECVLLNSCYSESQATAIAQHIDYVVGMPLGAGDRAALEFFIGFYDALGAGASIETAFDFGCNAIALSGIPEHLFPILRSKKERQFIDELTKTGNSLSRETNTAFRCV